MKNSLHAWNEWMNQWMNTWIRDFSKAENIERKWENAGYRIFFFFKSRFKGSENMA